MEVLSVVSSIFGHTDNGWIDGHCCGCGCVHPCQR
jgi:hypothetical protein